MRTLTAMAAITIFVLASVAPHASAKVENTKGPEHAAASGAGGAGRDDSGIALRRDGSEAVPFVAELTPTAADGGVDGFDWGDAAAGAGMMIVLLGLGATGWIAARRRRESRVGQVGVAH